MKGACLLLCRLPVRPRDINNQRRRGGGQVHPNRQAILERRAEFGRFEALFRSLDSGSGENTHHQGGRTGRCPGMGDRGFGRLALRLYLLRIFEREATFPQFAAGLKLFFIDADRLCRCFDKELKPQGVQPEQATRREVNLGCPR